MTKTRSKSKKRAPRRPKPEPQEDPDYEPGGRLYVGDESNPCEDLGPGMWGHSIETEL